MADSKCKEARNILDQTGAVWTSTRIPSKSRDSLFVALASITAESTDGGQVFLSPGGSRVGHVLPPYQPSRSVSMMGEQICGLHSVMKRRLTRRQSIP